jgi:sporulation protein YlmC with PRC-barrel domain
VLLAFDLLDRQIVDRDGTPVGKVDDLELTGAVVTALLTGQQALGPRFGGVLGRWIRNTAYRLDVDRIGPRRIPYHLVARVDSAVHLSVRVELLDPPPLERWLDEHLIGRIPGADHAG